VSTKPRFVETWIRDDGHWDLARYAYDLLLVPGPGRFGFHWHDGVAHTHCVDPRHPERDHHFDGGRIDLFNAAERFGVILNGTEPLTCAGLRQVRWPARHVPAGDRPGSRAPGGADDRSLDGRPAPPSKLEHVSGT
jgi:hypothetical protein